jgi:CO/xanthine dehydrogenase Mo-binding subunit
MTTGNYSSVGRAVSRADGMEKVTGLAVYGVDATRPGMLWGKVLRSPVSHARIVNIDTSRAVRLPGVRAIITGKDLPSKRVGRMLKDAPVLALDRVLFIGEKMAAVAADSPEIAEEARSLIDVEYEELPAVFDPIEAMQSEAPILHPELPPYEGLTGPVPGATNTYGRLNWSQGDVEKGFSESDFVFEHTFRTQLMHQGYLEPHACLVDIDSSGRVHVWATNKTPYNLRKQLAEAADLYPEQVVVHPSSIGGDFGGKGSFMDVPVCYHLARVSGKPVKMVMTYSEELTASNPRHPSVITIKTGLKKDGLILARDVKLVFNRGASGAFIPTLFLGGARYALGCYRIPHVRIEGYMVYTNSVPCGHMRAPGEAQVLFAVESHTDMIAKQLDKDPYEFRLQNVIREGDVAPSWETSDGMHLEPFNNVRGEEILRRAAESSGWYTPRPGPAVGRGMAMANRRPGAGVTTATVTLDSTGGVTLSTPVYETGTGATTIFKQFVAEELGVPDEEVTLEILDTDASSYDSGVGAMRVTNTHGWATVYAARELKAELKRVAATLFEWPEDYIVFEQSQIMLRGHPEQALSFKDFAGRAVGATGKPIVGQYHLKSDLVDSTAFCVQVAEVAVDTETGQVRVLKLFTTHDVGTILNPLTHQGQIEGGMIQGLGFALIEEMSIENGQISTLNLGDYKLPNIKDAPRLVTVLVPGAQGPLPYGAWGIGESSLAPVAPAVASAIEDAVGVRITELPITAEKILEALKTKAKDRSTQEPQDRGDVTGLSHQASQRERKAAAI